MCAARFPQLNIFFFKNHLYNYVHVINIRAWIYLKKIHLHIHIINNHSIISLLCKILNSRSNILHIRHLGDIFCCKIIVHLPIFNPSYNTHTRRGCWYVLWFTSVCYIIVRTCDILVNNLFIPQHVCSFPKHVQSWRILLLLISCIFKFCNKCRKNKTKTRNYRCLK